MRLLPPLLDLHEVEEIKQRRNKEEKAPTKKVGAFLFSWLGESRNGKDNKRGPKPINKPDKLIDLPILEQVSLV